ncbi:MAG: ABC transporter permease [Rhodospirillales bacterium]|nr:ABC transporter permease [Rhodospirillales bacterium]
MSGLTIGTEAGGGARLRAVLGGVFPFLVVAALWEALALAHVFPKLLFPDLRHVAGSVIRLAASGVLLRHTLATMGRLVAGFAIAAALGVALGLAMGVSRAVEDYLLPLVSILAPIPGLAYTPLFLLWFGTGDLAVVLLVGFVSAFPVIYNTWTGVRSVKEIWLRAARAMGAADHALFLRVVLPGALPYVLTGLRLGLAQAWRILVAAEMLAGVPWGLGWLIFGAREFLDTGAMLTGVLTIGVIGLILEQVVFRRLEAWTVIRWGMIAS